MHPRNCEPVPGHADKSDEPFVSCLDRRVERAALPQGALPFDCIDEVVQLQQVDPVHAETVERAADLFSGARMVAPPSLGGEEEAARVPSQPRGDSVLRVAIRGGGVDVVHAVLEQRFQRAVRCGLRDGAEGRCTKDRACALVTGTSERRPRDHVTDRTQPNPLSLDHRPGLASSARGTPLVGWWGSQYRPTDP